MKFIDFIIAKPGLIFYSVLYVVTAANAYFIASTDFEHALVTLLIASVGLIITGLKEVIVKINSKN